MRQTSTTVRVISLALIAVAAVATTGCFKKGARGDYALAPEMRPLEVPPDLNVPGGTAAVAAASQASSGVLASDASRPAASSSAQGGGFIVAGSKAEVFEKTGNALAAVEGVAIASRAQLLGSFDVAYEGSNFLVRVVDTEGGTYVSAVDPRGLPATDAAPVKLIGQLKTALGGR